MVDVERLHIYESDKHPGVYRVMQAGPARDGGVVNKVSFMRTILYLVAETSELFNIVQYQAILDANTDWGPKGRSSPAWITRGGHSSDLQVFRARILQEI